MFSMNLIEPDFDSYLSYNNYLEKVEDYSTCVCPHFNSLQAFGSQWERRKHI